VLPLGFGCDCPGAGPGVRQTAARATRGRPCRLVRKRPGQFGARTATVCERRIERDRAAVEAALSRSESNGQTEGQVTRLKLIKREMYGRAKFDLLRLRVIHAA